MWVDPDAFSYLPILILLLVGAVIGIALISANKIFGKKPSVTHPERYDAYECGVPTIGDARQQFSVRYYLIGIVFLLFDVEVVFMYPWAVVYKKFLTQGPFILFQMLTFFVILGIGYVYLIGRKGLDWE
jgi:NADH-quinone oxidoreductase subunit A